MKLQFKLLLDIYILFHIYVLCESVDLLNEEDVQMRTSEKKCAMYIEYDNSISDLPQIQTITDESDTFNNTFSDNKEIKKRNINVNEYKAIEHKTPLITTSFTIHSYVVGGEDADEDEFPHMAALGYEENNEKLFLCGGTLVSENFVLTAAHCLYSQQYGLIKWIRLGAVHLDQPNVEDFQVEEAIAHPKYLPPSTYHDIALIKLDRDVTFSKEIRPACLYSDPTIFPGVDLRATGWGLTEIGSSATSNTLQKVILELFSNDDCADSYKDLLGTRKLKDGIKHPHQFCAGSRNSNKDTCQGDSGGPLSLHILQTHFIVGITSFGKTCGLANHPGVYIRVSQYLPWLESIIWSNEL